MAGTPSEFFHKETAWFWEVDGNTKRYRCACSAACWDIGFSARQAKRHRAGKLKQPCETDTTFRPQLPRGTQIVQQAPFPTGAEIPHPTQPQPGAAVQENSPPSQACSTGSLQARCDAAMGCNAARVNLQHESNPGRPSAEGVLARYS
jgi:hypothetical protein